MASTCGLEALPVGSSCLVLSRWSVLTFFAFPLKIEVKVQRTVESKYDVEVDVDALSVTAESAREAEEP